MEAERAPVMADVARIAGVSHQTVSRVLNDHPNVRARTRERVLAAVRELGYRPNAAARTLATRRTRTLGVISFNTTLYGPACMLYGIEQAAREHEYSVTVAAVGTLDRRSVLDAVDRLRNQGVAGIVVIAPQTAAVGALANVPADVPLVAVGCGTHTALASVAVDNEAGAELATSYLLDLGHRTVHHLVGPRTWLDAQEREAGWRATLEKRGAPVPEPHAGADWTARTGYEHGRRIADDPEVTAVFCANDHMALGLLRALQQAGRRVPEDISVVGFDDMPETEYFGPSLTTVRQDFDELGRRALRALIEIVGDPDSGIPASGVRPHIVIPPSLVVRTSATRPRHRTESPT
ncbi:substrate-binding domain-containing protein [Streptomyces griseorubiginosus]|uniref:LacI family DNA-binding transcriptional regulator n=1 Tax=Streptomyces griseorubiginosus TaxID=67304 RepID=UPI002E80CA9C|nr:substrate-binding domain-containing protein [Streptomyces griseorubiginosus]WUB47529.1 substrate-binding domain-containing protein [Streptomyces griseorubiginosus]WUB56054.1 substrate-binding domain-containing protein [Streptomyces griseorubiginosus]